MSIFKREITGLEQVEAVEGEIREFVRRDVAGLRQYPENDGKVVVDTISSLASARIDELGPGNRQAHQRA